MYYQYLLSAYILNCNSLYWSKIQAWSKKLQLELTKRDRDKIEKKNGKHRLWKLNRWRIFSFEFDVDQYGCEWCDCACFGCGKMDDPYNGAVSDATNAPMKK